MAQDVFEKNIGEEWVPFTDIVTSFSASKSYQFQNRGSAVLVALEVAEEPAADEQGGELVLPYEVWTYEPEADTMLYLRAFSNTCSVNITSK